MRSASGRWRATHSPGAIFVAPAADAGVVVSEPVVARILEAAALPRARGRLGGECRRRRACREAVGYPVVVKAVRRRSRTAPRGPGRARLEAPDDVARADAALPPRAAALGAPLDGVWFSTWSTAGASSSSPPLRDTSSASSSLWHRRRHDRSRRRRRGWRAAPVDVAGRAT